MKAVWKGEVIAESEMTVVVDRNHYFPPDAINKKYFKESQTMSVCPWKGTASYQTVQVGGEEIADAAWYYPDPKDAAAEIKDHIAFWRGVDIQAS
jgi:uncharacterized protein (DUF427 family)